MTSTTDRAPNQVDVNCEGLAALLKAAERAGTVSLWCALALEWAAKADAEIRRLRATKPGDVLDGARYRWLKAHWYDAPLVGHTDAADLDAIIDGQFAEEAIDVEREPTPPEPSGEVLPCDVMVAPATIVRKGCKVATLMTAIEQRRTWDDVPPLAGGKVTLPTGMEKSPDETRDETGWLIERALVPMGQEYVGVVGGPHRNFAIVYDASRALRFARKADAQAVVDSVPWFRKHGPFKVEGHEWPSIPRNASDDPTVLEPGEKWSMNIAGTWVDLAEWEPGAVKRPRNGREKG